MEPRACIDRPAMAARTLLLVSFMVFAYWPALNGGFIWDDDLYIADNPSILYLTGLFRMWLSFENHQYYPLLTTSFWIEHKVWGMNPIGYHIVNLVLHLANALLVWHILRRLGMAGAFWVAAIFALHPVQVQSVAWIAERKNTLSTFFYLCSLLAFLRHDESNNPRAYLISIGLFLMAVLSKSAAVTLPLAVLIIQWWKKRPLSAGLWLRLVPFFLIALGMGLVAVHVEYNQVGAADSARTLAEKFVIVGKAFWFYLWKCLWPLNLSFVYDRWSIPRPAHGTGSAALRRSRSFLQGLDGVSGMTDPSWRRCCSFYQASCRYLVFLMFSISGIPMSPIIGSICPSSESPLPPPVWPNRSRADCAVRRASSACSGWAARSEER